MWPRIARLLRAATGNDGTGAVRPRLAAASREIIRLAFAEASALGHPCIADEHVLICAAPARGLDPDAASDGLERFGRALVALGIDAADIRQRLEARFGTSAVQAAERRVRRRPRWRGGHPRPDPLCVHLLAKRAPILAGVRSPRTGRKPAYWTRIDRDYETLRTGMQDSSATSASHRPQRPHRQRTATQPRVFQDWAGETSQPFLALACSR